MDKKTETPEHPLRNAIHTMYGFIYFISAREELRIRKASGNPPPWTEDPVLARYKFTNVRRQDDRVSKWFIKHLIEPNTWNLDLWFTLFIGRLINWPPTLTRLLEAKVIPCKPSEFNAEKFVTVLEEYKATGAKIYSGAYMVYPTKLDKGGPKSRAIAKHIIGDVIAKSDAISAAMAVNRIEVFVAEMSKCFGVSTFIAGQVAADLTYAPGHLDKAFDLLTFAPLGPGSQRGLNYLYNRKPYQAWTQEEFNKALMTIRQEIYTELAMELTLHNVQNVACEYSKFAKSVLGQGRPKTQYRPETAF